MPRNTAKGWSMAQQDGVHNLNCKQHLYRRRRDMHMSNYNKITALYSRLSVGDEDRDGGESNSISNQELICKGWFLPPNTYDCGSFVVN